MKKLLSIILVIAAVTGVFGTVAIFADFGSGVAVLADEEKLIKTGLYGKKLSFSDTDFKQGLAISDFDSIKITELPKSTEGTLMLAGRRISEGTSIRRKNIGALVFIPASKDVSESKFKFTISPSSEADEIEFLIRFTDKINYEPEIDSTAPTSLTTQRDISIFGKLSAHDKEGDQLEFMIIEYPSEGVLKLSDKKNGEFCYTPSPEFIGTDKFSYVVRDEWGNFSRLGYMTLSVSERLSEVIYEDMKNTPEYSASVALTAMGVMSGKLIGDGTYFMPDENVTRAEFVTMLMKTLGLKADSTIHETYFDDNEDIPAALRSYIGTAQRAGFISGDFEKGELIFRPNESITSYEAAGIIRKALGEKAKVDVPASVGESTVPVWAREDVYTMCTLGIYDGEFASITKDDTVTRRECAAYLYKVANM